MADNKTIKDSAGTDFTLALLDVSSVFFPKGVKHNTAGNADAYGSGANGATVPRVALATDSPGVTTLGQSTAAGSLPVVEASDYVPLGGYSIFRSLDLDETEEAVKATPGQLYKLRISNFATTVRYVKIYNDTVANVIVGTTVPVDTIPIPPAAAAGNPTVITESYGPAGAAFSAAITAAATTGLADNDTGAPGTNDIVITAFYK
jgi:hypothetical protein